MKKHISPGILLMAKTGKIGNRSQFFICTAKTEWLDRKQVVFGEVVQGFDFLKAVDNISSITGLTSKPVMVIDCGQLCLNWDIFTVVILVFCFGCVGLLFYFVLFPIEAL